MSAIKDNIDFATVEAARALESDKYDAGFVTDVEQELAPKGLNEDIVRYISAKKEEPEWMLEWRLKAYERWLKMEEPDWAMVNYPPIDYQDAYYYAEPKLGAKYESLDDVPPEILETYEKLGIPLREAEVLLGVEGAAESAAAARETPRIAVDAVFDSVSVVTTFQEELKKAGVIFMSISEAVREHPELVKKYLGTVVPQSDNFFATLNCAVFSDGTFVYVPKGVRCPMELSTYFRMNAEGTGQFERTLIIADEGSYVSYLEGCTAPMRDENQLHAAVVELVALEDAEIKYSTVQNWWPGDEDGKGGIYNFVTKRGDCRGARSKISWTQVETGSAVTWKYPSCILRGDDSVGEFYSIAVTNGRQQADTGTKMIHLGKNTRSRIISKGISAGKSNNTYRGLVSVNPKAKSARNFTQCDSLLIGQTCGAHTVPYVENRRADAQLEHEATTTKLSDDQLFYCRQRGLDEEEAVALLVNGFVRDVIQKLPMEFAVEAQKLLEVSLEGSVG
ncbi:MAG: Fe-S cluster assembly protein SufB [Pseudomonadota bacterium]